MLETTTLFTKVSLCFTQTCICWALFLLFARVEMTTDTHPHKHRNETKALLLRFKPGLCFSRGRPPLWTGAAVDRLPASPSKATLSRATWRSSTGSRRRGSWRVLRNPRIQPLSRQMLKGHLDPRGSLPGFLSVAFPLESAPWCLPGLWVLMTALLASF